MFLPVISFVSFAPIQVFGCILVAVFIGWLIVEISFSFAGVILSRCVPVLNSHPWIHNVFSYLPQMEGFDHDHILIVWSIVVAWVVYIFLDFYPSVVSIGIVICNWKFSTGTKIMFEGTLKTFNLAPKFAIDTVGLETRTTTKKQTQKYLACGGALRMIEDDDVDVKKYMHTYMLELTKDFIKESNPATCTGTNHWEELRKYHKESDQEKKKRQKYSEYFNLQHIKSWNEAYHVASLAWRLGIVSLPAIKFTFWIVGFLSVRARKGTIEVATEIALLLAFDSVLTNFDVVQKGKGCSTANPVFTSDSDLVTVPFKHDGTGYVVYDNRQTNIFGAGMAMCPGRFFVGDLYLSQPKFDETASKFDRWKKSHVC